MDDRRGEAVRGSAQGRNHRPPRLGDAALHRPAAFRCRALRGANGPGRVAGLPAVEEPRPQSGRSGTPDHRGAAPDHPGHQPGRNPDVARNLIRSAIHDGGLREIGSASDATKPVSSIAPPTGSGRPPPRVSRSWAARIARSCRSPATGRWRKSIAIHAALASACSPRGRWAALAVEKGAFPNPFPNLFPNRGNSSTISTTLALPTGIEPVFPD